MALTFRYFDNWIGTVTTCRKCGWEGPLAVELVDTYEACMAAECPKCWSCLAVFSYPSDSTIRRAAAAGNAEAIRMRAESSRNRKATKRQEELAAARGEPIGPPADYDALPDLPGGPHSFVWHHERGGDDVAEIRCGDQVLWREHAGWEHWERFNEVARLLKRRYGADFVRIDPGPEAWATDSLRGDSLRSKLECEGG